MKIHFQGRGFGLCWFTIINKLIMSEKIIVTENLVKRFPVGEGEFTALSDINLSFQKGEFAGIVGPSGSGKNHFVKYYRFS